MKKSRRAWSKEEDELLIKLITDGKLKTAANISAYLGRAKSSVLKRASDLGHRFVKNKLRRFSEKMLNDVKFLLDSGKSYEEIAVLNNISSNSARYLAYRYKLFPREEKKWTPEKDRLMISLVQNKNTTKSIVARLRVSKSQVMKRLKELFIDLPTDVKLFVNDQTDAKKRIIQTKLGFSKKRAKQMGWGYELSYEYILELFDKQNGRCYYTDIPMTFLRHDPHILSIDRKDSKKGYTKDNIVLCIWNINRMKQDIPFDRFVELCTIIAHRYNSPPAADVPA